MTDQLLDRKEEATVFGNVLAALNVKNDWRKAMLGITARGARVAAGETEPFAGQVNSGIFIGPVINTLIANKIEGSLNTVAQASVSDDLKRALDVVREQVVETLAAMPPAQQTDADDLGSALEMFSKQAIAPSPLKEVVKGAGRELASIAKRVAGRGEPVVAAVNVVLEILRITGIS